MRAADLAALLEFPGPSVIARCREIEAMYRRHHDRMKQHMLNNIWDNNPGELDRWADDGGKN